MINLKSIFYRKVKWLSPNIISQEDILCYFIIAVKGFKNYFVITFNQPFAAYGTWDNQSNTIAKNNMQDSGNGRGVYIQFKSGVQVEAKIASSYISIQQAELTLQKELGSNTFEQTEAAAGAAWEFLAADATAGVCVAADANVAAARNVTIEIAFFIASSNTRSNR